MPVALRLRGTRGSYGGGIRSWIHRNCILWPALHLRGERVAKYLREYRVSQWFSGHDLRNLQLTALEQLLRYAVEYSTFHRERIRFSGPWSPGAAEEVLRECAPMTKADLVDEIDAVRSSKRLRRVSSKTTGGSTGQPVTVYKNADAIARERAATFRAYEWAGICPGEREARFWGVPHSATRRRFYIVADAIANRKRFSAFRFDEGVLADHYRRLMVVRPSYIYGYVSMVRQLADFVTAMSLPRPRGLKAVITTSEVLSEFDRGRISKAFGVPVFNEYGCGEVGSVAHECEHGRLHLMAENLIVELLDGDDKLCDSGEVTVTDLHNRAMPLIRYRLGDFATFDSSGCECGRGLPTLKKVYGRAYDIVKTPEGKSFHPEAVIYIFEMLKERGIPVRQFQVEQIAVDELLVRIVRGPSFLEEHEARIIAHIHEYLSPQLRVTMEEVDAIGREASGKLRVVKSNVRA